MNLVNVFRIRRSKFSNKRNNIAPSKRIFITRKDEYKISLRNDRKRLDSFDSLKESE